MLMEANRWRRGIREGEVRCMCRHYGQQGAPLDKFGNHLANGNCAWEYAVARIYELERALGL